MFDFARNRQCAVRSRIQLVAADPPTAIRCWDGCAWWSWRLCIGSPGQCEKAPVWQVSINVVLVGPRLKICLVVLEWPLLHCVELLSRHQNDPKSGFWGLTVMRFGQKRCGCRSTSIFRGGDSSSHSSLAWTPLVHLLVGQAIRPWDLVRCWLQVATPLDQTRTKRTKRCALADGSWSLKVNGLICLGMIEVLKRLSIARDTLEGTYARFWCLGRLIFSRTWWKHIKLW